MGGSQGWVDGWPSYIGQPANQPSNHSKAGWLAWSVKKPTMPTSRPSPPAAGRRGFPGRTAPRRELLLGPDADVGLQGELAKSASQGRRGTGVPRLALDRRRAHTGRPESG